MMGYGDKTFCTDTSCENWKECHRALTNDVHKKASAWFGNDNYPILMFAGRVICYVGDEPYNFMGMGER